MPFVSVVIPIYNVENYLRQCVDSVLNQSFRDIEIILVNDGSTDSCASICDEYFLKDRRIKVIHKSNGGLSDARNVGLQSASGRYIVFLDSDDYWQKIEGLHILVDNALKYNPDVLLFQAQKWNEYNNSFIADVDFDVSEINGKNTSDVVKYLISSQTYSMSACTKLLNREFMINNKIVFEKGLLGEDLDWFMSLIDKNPQIYSVKENFYIYRWRSDSITQSIGLQNLIDGLYIIKKWTSKIAVNNNYYMGIIAYAYVVQILLYWRLDSKKRNVVKEELQNLAYLLEYDVNIKIKITKLVYKLFGLSLTSFLLNLYMKIKP